MPSDHRPTRRWRAVLAPILEEACAVLAPTSNAETRALLAGLEPLTLRGGVLELRLPDGVLQPPPPRLRARLAAELRARIGAPVRLSFVPGRRRRDPFHERPLVGAFNRTAHLLLEGLASGQAPPDLNPVYLFGPAGVGKTYLLHRFVRRSGRPAVLFDALDLHAQIARRLRSGRLVGFLRGLREAGVFVLDEVHRLQGKYRSQLEFAGLLDELLARGARVLLAGRHHPREIHRLGPQLSSRLLGGFVVELRRPDLEARRRFVRAHGLGRGARAEALAARPASFGELLAAARDGPAPEDPETRLAELRRRVARRFGLEPKAFEGKARHLVRPRQVLAFLGREAGLPGAAIARFCGWRSVSSVHHAVRRLRAELARDPGLGRLLEDCR